MKKIEIKTNKKKEVLDITDEILNALSIDSSMVVVFTPHTTACITINESEHGLLNDLITFSEKLTQGIDFEHNKHDNNADAHVISSFIGNSRVFFVEEGYPLLGTWQRILLIELDGPRTRTVFIKEIPL